MEVAVEGLAELRRQSRKTDYSHRAWISGETQSLYSQAAAHAVSLDQTFHSLVHIYLLEKSCHFLSKLVLHSAWVTIRFASSEHFLTPIIVSLTVYQN